MSRFSSIFDKPYEPNPNKRAIQSAQYAIEGIGRLQTQSYEDFSFNYQGKSSYLHESVENILADCKRVLKVETVDELKMLPNDVSDKVKELERALCRVTPLMQKVIEECNAAETERLEDEKLAEDGAKEKSAEPTEKKMKKHRY